MDDQEAAFRAELAQEQRASALEIQRLEDEVLRLTMNAVTFESGRSAIRPDHSATFDRVGALLDKYDRSVVHVVGHTDNVGESAFNDRLSRERAASVKTHFLHAGVEDWRIRTQGLGETRPIASNDSAEGRRANRRVEIYIKPLVEGNEAIAFQSPVASTY